MSPRFVRVLIALPFLSMAQSEEPQWLKDARAREGTPIAPVNIKSQDGWFSARVTARLSGAIVKDQGSYALSLDIGSDAPMQCDVVPEGFDMADRLARTFDVTIKRLEATQGKVEARQLEFTDAGAIGNVPYLETRWLLRVNDGKETRVGALKQVVLEKHGHGIYCAQFDVGFVKTFDAVTRSLAESFEAPPVGQPPYFFEIGTASIDGKKIGLMVTRLEQDADEDTKASQLTSLLLPAAAGALHTQDGLQVEWIKADGALINASQAMSKDGEIVIDATLTRSAGGWTIQGDSQGTPLDEKLPADVRPSSWVEQARGRRKLLASGNPIGVEYGNDLWVQPDLSRLTPGKTRVLARKGPGEFTARATSGNFTAELILDAKTGMPTSTDFPLGPLNIHVERVFVSGSF
jgi:hypothetical protein